MRFNSGGDDSGACAYKQEEDEWYCVVHGSCFAWNAVAAEALEGAVVCVNKKAVLCCHRQRTSPRTKKDCSTMTAILYLRKCNLFVCFEAGERDRRRRFRSTRIIFYGWRPRYLSWWMRRFHLESSLWDVREFANLLINLHHRMQNWRIVGGWLWQSGWKNSRAPVTFWQTHHFSRTSISIHVQTQSTLGAVTDDEKSDQKSLIFSQSFTKPSQSYCLPKAFLSYITHLVHHLSIPLSRVDWFSAGASIQSLRHLRTGYETPTDL